MITKEYIRRFLARRGWFLRKLAGLPVGVEFGHDWSVRLGLPIPRLVFDVGAHRGESCDRFGRDFPDATIHAFEPVSANFAQLQVATQHLPRVTCYQVALGARAERLTIALQSDSQTHSLRHLARPDATRTETITVTTLDEFCVQHHVSRVDFLKIDTEGYERAVLTGAHGMLSRGAIGPILLEATLQENDAEHTSLLALRDFLQSYGYDLAAIYDQVAWRRPVRLTYFNALFVPDRDA